MRKRELQYRPAQRPSIKPAASPRHKSTRVLSPQEIASLGSPDWLNPSVAHSLGTQDGQFGPGFSSRGVVKGSPVVPGSSQKVLEEGDQVLYTVTVLRGQYQVS